jgi:methionine aminopeptidase
MSLCIEPMFNMGGRETKVDGDGWTVRTKDGSLSAHWEHTVGLTPDGPMIFTVDSQAVPVDVALETVSSRASGAST